MNRPSRSGFVITIGSFDGVHLGHQEILRTARDEALARGTTACALTLYPHPRTVIGHAERVPYLTTLPDRLRCLEQFLPHVTVLDFNADLARLSARDFFEQVSSEMPITAVISGEDFRVGHGREAGVSELRMIGLEMGWELITVPPVLYEGEPVSSTRIRTALSQGNVELAAQLLGRPYELVGTVVRGAGRGRTIGIPTANVEAPEELLVPSNGVYHCVATVGGGRELTGVVNIGVRPTFDGASRSIEFHALDWSGDLYGQTLRLRFLHRIREERRFEGVEALIQQIQADIQLARTLPQEY